MRASGLRVAEQLKVDRVAKGVQRAGGELKRTFDEDLPDLWVLAMVVVQWYADQLPPAEAQAVSLTLKEFSLGALATNLNLFRERLLPFVKTAHEAQEEAQLAAAGAYFVAAVEQIGMRLLASAISAAPLQAVKERILLRVPPPAGLKEDYERALGWYAAGCEIVKMPGGHFMHREHPARFIKELLAALAAPPPAS